MVHYLFFAGIRVQSLKKGQITMDIDFRWGGDPNIILAVDALVASLPIQVRALSTNINVAICIGVLRFLFLLNVFVEHLILSK